MAIFCYILCELSKLSMVRYCSVFIWQLFWKKKKNKNTLNEDRSINLKDYEGNNS